MTLLLSSVFIAGILSFFAPCTYALMPAYIGILTDYNRRPSESLFKTLAFILGLAVSFVTLGFGAGLFGSLLQSDLFYWISGAIIILMGLHQMEWIQLRFLQKYVTPRFRTFDQHPVFSAFWIGLTFSFAWTPCVGPVLGSVLIIASQSSQALYGGLYMLIYTLGLALPFIVIAILSQFLLEKMIRLEKYLPKVKQIGGALIVLMGILIASRQLNSLTIWIERLF